MKTFISKLDNKRYWLCTAKFDAGIGNGIKAVCKGEKYQVRKATVEDCSDFENYCVVNGTFNDASDALYYDRVGINHYNGTYCFRVLIPVDECKRIFKYL